MPRFEFMWTGGSKFLIGVTVPRPLRPVGYMEGGGVFAWGATLTRVISLCKEKKKDTCITARRLWFHVKVNRFLNSCVLSVRWETVLVAIAMVKLSLATCRRRFPAFPVPKHV